MITGVSPLALASTVNAPPKMEWHAAAAFFDLDDVDEQAGADARGEPAGDLLAVGAGGQRARRPGEADSASAASTSTFGVTR